LLSERTTMPSSNFERFNLSFYIPMPVVSAVIVLDIIV
jgi:hypothetical protein